MTDLPTPLARLLATLASVRPMLASAIAQFDAGQWTDASETLDECIAQLQDALLDSDALRTEFPLPTPPLLPPLTRPGGRPGEPLDDGFADQPLW